MRPFLRALALALTCAFALAGCSGQGGDGTGGRNYVGAEPSTQIITAADREAAPDVSGDTLDGEQIALADLRGPVVVNFWASWCGPCAKEAPELEALSKQYKGEVSFIGVNVKDGKAAAQAFERNFGVTYPSWEDPAATIAASFGGIGPAALPSTLVLDAEHRVAVRFFGAVDGARLGPVLDGMLSEATAE